MCSNVLTFPEERSEHWIKPGSIPLFVLDILELNVLIKGIFHIYFYHSMNQNFFFAMFLRINMSYKLKWTIQTFYESLQNIERNKTVKSGVCKYHWSENTSTSIIISVINTEVKIYGSVLKKKLIILRKHPLTIHILIKIYRCKKIMSNKINTLKNTYSGRFLSNSLKKYIKIKKAK